MGTFSISIDVGDPTGQRFEIVRALVGTRATFTVLPSFLLEQLGVTAHRTATFELPDGTLVERQLGRASVRISGPQEETLVIFGANDSGPVLGTVTLEHLRQASDSINERLVSVPGLLKSPRHPLPEVTR